MRRPHAIVAAATLALSLVLTACGGGSGTSTSPGASSPSSPPVTQSGSPTAAASSPSVAEQEQAVSDFLAKNGQKPPANTPTVTGALGSKPVIAKPTGTPPGKIVVKDLVTGTGKKAALISQLSVDYVGVEWDTGKQFDSSFDRGQPATFGLNSLILCWQAGIPGMKEGGRRELICPPDYAYGKAGSGSELAGKTLVFVIDLKKVA